MRKTVFSITLVVLLAIFAIMLIKELKHNDYIAYGDSITYYDGVTYSDGSKCIGYQREVKELLDIDDYDNISECGLTMAANSDGEDGLVNAICSTNNKHAKVCTIAIGTNDVYFNTPLGQLQTDSAVYDDKTFIGAYQKSIEYIQEQNSDMIIVLITPIQRDAMGFDNYTANDNGFILVDYVEAIKSIGDYYNLPVCDLYNNSGITMDNISEYTIDGLHPNNEGYRLMGVQIARTISEAMN